MILIIGATGTIGRETAAKLVERGLKVRALSRDAQKAQALPELKGVEVATGDPAKPETLDAAMAGVEKVLLIPPGGPDWNVSERNVIDAARRAGVKQLVKISVVGPDPKDQSMNLSFHAQGEAYLQASGLGHTIMRPNSIMQNFIVFYASTIKSDGAVYQCTGDAKMAMIDTRDIADVAVHVLTTDGHLGKIYELTGPEALNYTQAAKHIGEATSREIRHVDIPPAAYEQALLGAGLPGWMATEIVNIYGRGLFHDGGAAQVTSTVSELLGRPPRSFADFARDFAAAFRP